MILSFRHKGLRKFFESGSAAGVQPHHAKRLRMLFAALDTAKQAELQADILELLGRMNRGGKDSLVIPSEYLEVVVTRE